MEWVYLIAIGFICVAYPILLFLSIWFTSWYIILAYFLWLVLCVYTIIYFKKMNLKWYECIGPSAVFTILFTFILSMFMQDIVFVIAPSLNLPAMYYFAMYIYDKIIAYERNKKNSIIAELRLQIYQYEDDIYKLKIGLRNQKRVLNLIKLMDFCDTKESKRLIEDKNVNNVLLILETITEKQNLIEKLKIDINQLQNS